MARAFSPCLHRQAAVAAQRWEGPYVRSAAVYPRRAAGRVVVHARWGGCVPPSHAVAFFPPFVRMHTSGVGGASRSGWSERYQRMHSPLRDRGIGLLIGAALTLACSALYLCGSLERLDLFGLDLHFRHFSPMQADPRIVLVNIDDSTLRATPDWPWPRRLHAGLVRTLKELGADSIVLDFIFDRPSTARFGTGAFASADESNRDVEPPVPPTFARPTDDDMELRDAIADAGNVFLAMYAELAGSEHDAPTSPDLDRAIEALMDNFQLDVDRLAKTLNVPSSETTNRLAPIFAQAKRIAAGRLAEWFVHANPDGGWREFRVTSLPTATNDEHTADVGLLREAFRSARAVHAAMRAGVYLPNASLGARPVAPLEALGRAAKGVGIVSFQRSVGRGVLRSVPPFVRFGEVSLPQLGLRVAADVMGFDLARIWQPAFQDRVELGNERAGVSLNVQGETLIAWIRPKVPDDWRSVFDHVSASPFLEITLNREAISENTRRLAAATAELVRVRFAETPAEYQDYVRLLERRAQIGELMNMNVPAEQVAAIRVERQSIDESTRAIEADVIVWLRRAWELWANVVPESADEISQRATIQALHAAFIDRSLKERVDRSNQNLAARNERLLADLRPRIEGCICLVGYTASAQGDLVTTPTLTSMPGVMAHAHVINMLLQERVPRRAGAGFDFPLLLVLGAITAGIAGRWNAPRSLLGCGLLSTAVLLAAAWLFSARMIHVASIIGCVECAVVWAGVTTYRQLTEERTRRRFQRALSQYTSPAIAAHLAGQVRPADLAPRSAVVTCFFSDLRGFTRLSERLGPAKTRERLNPYLGVVSRALIDERAMVNKFIGDGVMAFFNAPILPCDDHAKAACRAALAARNAVARLDLPEGFVGDDDRLHVRIGLASGEAFVGDYGTDTKLDYTCIGDTVNVASRLERANKSLATQILVDRSTFDEAKDEFYFRRIGPLQVVGRQGPVECWELLGSAQDVSKVDRSYAEAFADVVRHFDAGRWQECAAALGTCRTRRPEDPLLNMYLELVTACQHQEPGSAPAGALRMPADA